MKLEIQSTIPNVPYSVNKQTVELDDDETPESLAKKIALAKAASDEVSRQWQTQPVLDAQTLGENELLRKANEKLDLATASKTLIIEALKAVTGEDKYEEILKEVLASEKFKSLTLHSSDEN